MNLAAKDRVRMSEEGARLMERGVSALKRAHRMDWRGREGEVVCASRHGVTVLWDGRKSADTAWPERLLEKI